MNFWEKLKKPIVGVAPMDGVTDAVFRHMICKNSRPSVVFTEFTSVEALARGVEKGLKAFIYSENERPIVAQIFGVEVESFYKAALIVCALGFDGVDINMGCPVKKVARKGSGAGLIKTPELAVKIIKTVKKAVKDWANGVSLEEAGVHENIILEVEKMNKARGKIGARAFLKRKLIPVSVKTRIGYEKNIVKDWMKEILKGKPDLITLHGRTLKQMYKGAADWEAIKEGGEVVKKAKVIFLGNGDVKSMEDAYEKARKYGVDGVLVGRSILGNPWFFDAKFKESDLDFKKRIEVAKEHLKYFEKLNFLPFNAIKKHLGWYIKGFNGAKKLRLKLMLAKGAKEARNSMLNFYHD